jgi:predicted anti-sigma-YlaC factor YlaD
MDMGCDEAHTAISARIDGEDPGCQAGALEEHLARCGACEDWQQRAYTLTRRARLGGTFLDHDLSEDVLAALPSPPRKRSQLIVRAALIAVALAQLAVTVPLLVLGHDHEAGVHAAHELGSFDLALAVAFVVGAIRPALSAGLAWPCGVAAGALVATAIADLISGQTIGADEAQHLIALAGAALLFWQARMHGSRAAGSLAAGPGMSWPAGGQEPDPGAGAFRPHGPPVPPDGSPGRPRRGGKQGVRPAGSDPGRDGGKEAVA